MYLKCNFIIKTDDLQVSVEIMLKYILVDNKCLSVYSAVTIFTILPFFKTNYEITTDIGNSRISSLLSILYFFPLVRKF